MADVIRLVCDREVHENDCCIAAPLDTITEGPLIDDDGNMTRQPTGAELHALQRAFYREMYLANEIAETTYHKLCYFTDHYVRLVDPEYWEEEPDGV